MESTEPQIWSPFLSVETSAAAPYAQVREDNPGLYLGNKSQGQWDSEPNSESWIPWDCERGQNFQLRR